MLQADTMLELFLPLFQPRNMFMRKKSNRQASKSIRIIINWLPMKKDGYAISLHDWKNSMEQNTQTLLQHFKNPH